MGDHDARDLQIALQLDDELVDHLGPDGVETGRGLVVEKHLRPQDDRPGQGDPLALASRELGGHLVGGAGHLHQPQQLPDPLVALPPRQIRVLHERERHVVVDGHGVEERAVLEEKPELAADRSEAGLPERVDSRVLEPHLPAIGSQEADEVLEHDGLAATARAQHHGGLAGGEVERDVAKHFKPVECFANAHQADDGAGLRAHKRLHMIIAMPESVDARTTHRGRLFSVEVLTWTDAEGRQVCREVVRHPGAVLIVPRLDGDRLVMVRNFRVAVDDRLWELPAGTLETDENPQEAAARELEEETGYRPGRMRRLGEFYTSPGFCNELMRVFVAEDLRFVGQRLEPGEQIQVEIVARAEALAMIDDGRIRDGKTIAGLLMWARGGEGLA